MITHLLHKSFCSPVLLTEGNKRSWLNDIRVCVCLCVVLGQCGGRCGQEQVLHAVQYVVHFSGGGPVALPGQDPCQATEATAGGTTCHHI